MKVYARRDEITQSAKFGLMDAYRLLSEAGGAHVSHNSGDNEWYLAHAAEIYARRQRLSQDSIDYAHAVKIDALTLLGDFLRSVPKATGAKGIGPIAVTKANRNKVPTLSESGITKKDSSTAQFLDTLEKKNPELFQEAGNNRRGISKARKLTRSQEEKRRVLANRQAKEAARAPPPASGRVFA
jgi:hypothetical protein